MTLLNDMGYCFASKDFSKVKIHTDAEAVNNYSNILSGVVKLTKVLADGRQQIVGLQFAPDFLGRPFRQSSEINAEAATKVQLCSFPTSVIDHMIKDSPELKDKLLQQTLDELDEARGWMVTLGRKTAAEKVASFLYLIANNINPTVDDGDVVTFDLPLTRSDIADFLGLTIETVSRTFTKLRNENVIALEGAHHVIITDEVALEDLADAMGD